MTGTRAAARHGAERDGQGRRVVLLAAAAAVLLVGLGAGTFLLLHGIGTSDDAARLPVGRPPTGGASAAGVVTTAPGGAAPSGRSPTSLRPRAAGPVQDGDLEFTVTGVRAGVGSIGEGSKTRRPAGQFVLVTLSVRNRGQEQAFFDYGSQLLDDAQGRQVDAEDDAADYLAQARSFVDPVKAGGTVTGVLVFELPKGAVPVSVDLHGPDSEQGVSVTLG